MGDGVVTLRRRIGGRPLLLSCDIVAPNGKGATASGLVESPDRRGQSRIIRHAVVDDEGLDLALRHRLRKEISLHRRAAETVDDLGLLCRFHTFDHAVKFQIAAQVDHRLDDVAGVFLRRDIANEARGRS